MKNKKINFSLPASMSGFATDEKDTRFSRGKLNVFYKGTTADNRFFSEDFAERVAKTLAYAPVVGYYDQTKEDFVGHATEQAIYGIVDPIHEPEFVVMEDGNTWAVCDVVLYTERPGEVGEIAKKIVGHSQSLELNPSTVKYKINYDEKKHFKNLEFTEGEIIGVSVLGEEQQPAFTGSGFFSTSDFEEKMRTLKEYCDNSVIKNETEKGGRSMNSDFMELSWGDICEKVTSAICNEYENDGFTFLEEAFDNHIVVCLLYYTGGKKYLDIKYEITENGEVTLGEVVEVRPTYVPVEETTSAPAFTDENESTQVNEPVQVDENKNVDMSSQNGDIVTSDESVAEEPTQAEEEPTQAENDFQQGEQVKPEQQINDPQALTDVSNVNYTNNGDNNTDTNQQPSPDSQFQDNSSAVENANEEEQENSSTSAFTNSEQEELKNSQKREKIELVKEYRELLSDEDFTSFITNIDNYEYSNLATELLKICKKSADKPTFRAFYNPMKNDSVSTNNNDDLGHIINKVLNK